MSSAYELARLARISENQVYLASLGLSSARDAAREDLARNKARKAAATTKKRKRSRGGGAALPPTRKSVRRVTKVSYRNGGEAASTRAAPSAPADFVLPDGFETVFVKRKSGKQRGSEYKIYVAPNGQAFRSLVEVWRKVSGKPLQGRVSFPKWAQKGQTNAKQPPTQPKKAAGQTAGFP